MLRTRRNQQSRVDGKAPHGVNEAAVEDAELVAGATGTEDDALIASETLHSDCLRQAATVATTVTAHALAV